MKHKLFLATVIILSSSFILPAKELKGIVTPAPFAYQFGIMDAKTGRAKSGLQQTTAVKQPKKSTQTTWLYTFEGTRSSTRFKISNIVFQAVADDASQSLDPSNYIYLFKLNVDNTNRSFTVNTNGSSNAMLVPITISLFERTTYKIIVGAGWTPGEYAFMDKSTTAANGDVKVWTFGID